jgi:MerR family redox-sensitive transcriptional activator SoxR
MAHRCCALRELKALLASRPPVGDGWRELHQRKVINLNQRIARGQAPHTAIAHAFACQHEDISEYPNFAGVVAARLAGSSLEEVHPH